MNQLMLNNLQIAQLYQLQNLEESWRFLEEHQYLIPPLIEAPNYIRKYFPKAQLLLKYTPDPEIANYEQLMLYIATDQDVDEAHEAMKQFDRSDWWPSRRRFMHSIEVPRRKSHHHHRRSLPNPDESPSNYQNILEKLSKSSKYDEVLSMFNHKLSFNAKVYLKQFYTSRV